MQVISSLTPALTPTAIALGNFDGIHLGHRQVVQPILNRDDITHPTVVSFCPHPQEFFTGKPRQLLTPTPEKAKHLEALGVHQLILLPFDRELAALSPSQFVETILIQQLQAKRISVGENFCFGQGRTGTAKDLQAIASHYDIDVHIASLQTSQGEHISSSIIRTALQQGDIQRANRLLGRSYSLTGSVIKGQQLGRTINFPTANLQLPSEKFLPRFGVYCVQVWLEDIRKTPISGVMNIGSRPTVNGTGYTVEVHLLDWSGDLYGKTLTVSLEQFLRSEQKFPSLDALKTQIQADSNQARLLLGSRE